MRENRSAIDKFGLWMPHDQEQKRQQMNIRFVRRSQVLNSALQRPANRTNTKFVSQNQNQHFTNRQQ